MVVCVDCIEPNLAAKTLRHCRDLMKVTRPFERVVLFSNDYRGDSDIEFFQIPKLDRHGYSLWCLRELWRHATTDFVLTVQKDGYILNPHKWTEEFMEYDYIGAPWRSDMITNQDHKVGNSGFCLKSKTFCKETAFCAIPYLMQNEDVYMCQQVRGLLKVKFAPLELARRFSVENEEISENDTFGFHRITDKGRRVKLTL
jgi:hypothetical protein